jgi:hypothetical protein
VRETFDRRGVVPHALCYRRVSTEEQAREGVSLDAQRRITRRAIVEHGWLPAAEFEMFGQVHAPIGPATRPS